MRIAEDSFQRLQTENICSVPPISQPDVSMGGQLSGLAKKSGSRKARGGDRVVDHERIRLAGLESWMDDKRPSRADSPIRLTVVGFTMHPIRLRSVAKAKATVSIVTSVGKPSHDGPKSEGKSKSQDWKLTQNRVPWRT